MEKSTVYLSKWAELRISFCGRMANKLSDSFLAGSISGVLTRIVASPLDVLKVRLQLQIDPTSYQNQGGAKYGGVFHAARTIFREEGVTAFWKGFLAGQLLYIIYSGAQFTFYELCRKQLTMKLPGRETLSQNAAINFVSGCGAGGVATLVSFPFDVLRTRMIGQGEPKIYTSLFKAVQLMYCESGWRGFYRGLSPALLSITPQAGIYFTVYKTCCALWERSSITKNEDGEGLKWAVSGGVAGVTSKVIMLPLDIVKKRLEVQGFEHARRTFGTFHQYNGPLHCLASIYRHEGLLAFYKGATPSLIKATFGVSLSFSIYEHILKFLKDTRSNK